MSDFGPSFYGEVLSTSSRAIDEEEDEEDALDTCSSGAVIRWTPSLQAVLDSGKKISCNVLVIAIDKVATGFIQTHFLNEDAERIGVLCTGLREDTVNSLDQDQFTDETCYVYRLKNHPSALFCQCNTKITPEQTHSWVCQLFPCISTVETYVAVLSHRSVADYRCEQPTSQLKVPFLKSLKTSHFGGSPLCEYLEQPNIVESLPAQILTYCQIRKLPAVLYVCYTENAFMDIQAVMEFSRLTSVTPFKDFYKPNPDHVRQLKRLVDQSNINNTLYM